MIYNSTITSVNESDIMSLLENVEDRFENYTIAEATAITLGEQEQNWTRFMKGVGLSELATIIEGQEVIYEGARLKGLIAKAKEWFKVALNKLAEITKSFIAKFDQIFKSNDAFVKKYEATLTKNGIPSDFKFKGYEFKNMEKPEYKEPGESPNITASNANAFVEANKDKYTKEHAEELLVGKVTGDNFSEKLHNYFYGSKEKQDLNNINIGDQIKILKKTKDIKKEAQTSYKETASRIKKFISALEKAEKEALKKPEEGQSIGEGQRIDAAYNLLISYWKAYSSCAHQKHGAYLRALGARNSQAKAICTKLLTGSYASKGKADRAKIRGKEVTEGFVNTDAFLGAVEFI